MDKNIRSSAISEDGKYLVIGAGWTSGSDLGRLYVYSIGDNLTEEWTHSVSGYIYSVAISSNGSHIVTGGQDGKVRWYSVVSSTPLETHTVADVNQVTISSDGQTYAAVCDNNKVFLFEGEDEEWSYSISEDILSAKLTPDGSTLVVGADDDKIYYFDASSSTPSWSEDVGGAVWGIDISDDGQYVAVASQSEEVYLFNSTGSQIWKYESDNDFELIRISEDGKYVIAGDVNGNIFLFGVDSSTPIAIHDVGDFAQDDEYSPQSLAMSNYGDWISVASTDGTLDLFRNPNNFAPYISNLLPTNDTRVINSTTTLSWSATDYELEDSSIEYTIFFGTDKDNLNSVSDNQTASSWTTTALTRGTTYWWQIRAYDGEAYRYSDKLSFSRNTLPVINQTTPANDSYIPDKNGYLQFVIQATDADSDSFTYELYMGTNPNNLVYYANSDTGTIETNNFIYNRTYFWKVKVKDGYEGVYSNIRQFVVFDSIVKPSELNEWALSEVSTSDDGKVIATVGYSLKVYGNDSLVPIWTNSSLGGTSQVRAVQVSSDGEYIAIACPYKRGITLFRSDNSTALWSNCGSNNEANEDIAISGNGDYIGSLGNELYLYSKDNSTALWSYDDDNEITQLGESLAISEDGDYIVIGTYSDNVVLFSNNNNTPIWSYNFGSKVRTVDISSDGNYIIAGSDSGAIALFNKNSSTPVWYDYYGSKVESVKISEYGDYIIAGFSNGDACLFGKENNEPIWCYEAGSSVKKVSISKNSEKIIAGNSDGEIHYFDKSSDNPIWIDRSATCSDYVTSISMSENGKFISVLRSSSWGLSFLHHNNEKSDSRFAKCYDSGDYVSAVSAISGDGNFVITGTSSGDLDLIKPDNHSYVFSYDCYGSVEAVAISGRGDYFASACGGTNIHFVDVISDTSWHGYDGESSEDILFLSMSSDGNYLVAGNAEYIYLYGKNSNEYLWKYQVDNSYGVENPVMISDNGNYIVASNISTVLLFSIESNTPLWSYEVSDYIQAVDISSDGEYIIVGDKSSTVSLFRKDNSTPVWDHDTYYGGMGILSGAISSDGDFLAVGTDQGKVWLFSRNSSTPLWNHSMGDVRSITISADGEYLSAVSSPCSTCSGYGAKFKVFHRSSSTPLHQELDDYHRARTTSMSNSGF